MMTDEYRFRPATEADLDAVAALYRVCAANAHTHGNDDWAPDEYPNRQFALEDLAQNGLFVLEKDGEIISAVSLLPHGDLDGLDVRDIKKDDLRRSLGRAGLLDGRACRLPHPSVRPPRSSRAAHRPDHGGACFRGGPQARLQGHAASFPVHQCGQRQALSPHGLHPAGNGGNVRVPPLLLRIHFIRSALPAPPHWEALFYSPCIRRYFSRVASPPRRWRSRLFCSSTARTCVQRTRSI